MKDIGRSDSIFDLGGNSLSIYGIASRMTDELDVSVKPVDLMTYTSISELAAHIAEDKSGKTQRTCIQGRQDEALAGRTHGVRKGQEQQAKMQKPGGQIAMDIIEKYRSLTEEKKKIAIERINASGAEYEYTRCQSSSRECGGHTVLKRKGRTRTTI